MRRRTIVGAVPALVFPSIARAANEDIKVGNIMPYSGPASALSEVGKAETAYVQMLNERGGINGRRINFITLDDGYSPPKAVEHARRLIENDRVAMMFSPLGTPSISATIKYINDRKVPHLFAISGVSRFCDAALYPFTVTGLVNYQVEARIHAKLIDKERPNARIAVLYQNDDLGKDYVAGLRTAYAERFNDRVVMSSYELTDPTIESQVIALKATGAEILILAATPKFASQAIRKAYELQWKAMIILNVPSSSIVATLQPAGFDRSVGVVSGAVTKDPDDPNLAKDPEVEAYRAFTAKYLPGANASDANIVYGYMLGSVLEHLLQKCGNDVSRDNIMRQALAVRDFVPAMVWPGIVVNTGRHQLLTQLQLQRWNGKANERVGSVLSGAGE